MFVTKYRREVFNGLKLPIIVDTWVSDQYGDPHVEVHPHHPADAPGKVPTGYGFWCNAWPENPAWKFVAVGVGHDVPYWTEFLRALAEVDPDMAVNIEHENAAYSQTEGLALAAKNLQSAATAL
ncbi:hypothetical protein ACFRFU_33675 [Streptomyces sp. NPDC056704]|uniref:hypothetical protein n=1 Tax=Streptomyces sp. NPDC056704 TaxID=3345917 RepID=UPI00367D67FE